MFSNVKILSKKAYLVGVLVIFAAVYSQYVFALGTVLGFLVVYGVPVVVVGLVFGREIFRNAGSNGKLAFKLGLGFFGVFTVVGYVLSFVALLILLSLDPQVVNLLNKPNPVLQVPQEVAWAMVAVSILVVGPSEEFLFRGFMFGGLLNISRGRHWFALAIGSSLLFASVHAYYAITYGLASVVPFIDLVTFAIAMSATFYVSNGNLVVPALIHGFYDATAFLGVATSVTLGLALRTALVAVALVFAVVYLRRRNLPGREIKVELTSPLEKG